MSDFECRNEMVTRERSGGLSAAERVALDAHLAQCASCRLSRVLGRDFDAEATLEAGDGPRIAALSAVAEAWARGRPAAVTPPVKRRRVRVALLAVAAALAAVGASAARGTWSQLFGDEPVVVTAPMPPAATEPAMPPTATQPAPVRKPETTAAVAPQTTETRSRAPSESAASLFKQASDARRAGDAERAIALYRRLEHEFPASAEAGLAALPLGGLLLDRGQARAALGEFDRHVRSGGSSRLLPEALYGRGRSLAALGNRSEERRTWTRLLAEFPESPYARHAKRRLGELDAAD
jgi:TolA-binding protein